MSQYLKTEASPLDGSQLVSTADIDEFEVLSFANCDMIFVGLVISLVK